MRLVPLEVDSLEVIDTPPLEVIGGGVCFQKRYSRMFPNH